MRRGTLSVLVAAAAIAAASVATAASPKCLNPRFVARPGWRTIALGSVCGQIGRSASAANVPFARPDYRSSAPTSTAASLPSKGVLIWAQFEYSGRSIARDQGYPKRRFPLKLAEARASVNPEGFDAPGRVLHLLARARGYDVFIYVFFGSARPTAATLRLADRQLALLRLP